MKPLPAEFFEQPVLKLGRALIGKHLVHASPEGVTAGRIVETEAYRGPEDLAAHSARGRHTKRTAAMFGPAGHAYMFLLYGISWAFNVTAGPVGDPHAVLVRAIEPIEGLAIMAARRSKAETDRELTNGPGKLCAALGLDRRHYGMCLWQDELFVADGAAGSIGRSTRINIDYAGVWTQRPWRFYERNNRYVSVAPRG